MAIRPYENQDPAGYPILVDFVHFCRVKDLEMRQSVTRHVVEFNAAQISAQARIVKRRFAGNGKNAVLPHKYRVGDGRPDHEEGYVLPPQYASSHKYICSVLDKAGSG
jgi:hypothetical protein